MRNENKELPHDTLAEVSVLGSIILFNESLGKVHLQPEMFALDAHPLIFRAILKLAKDGIPTDLVTLRNGLAESGELREVGGVSYLAYLVEAVPSAANAEHYANIVADKWALREVLKVCDKMSVAAFALKPVDGILAGVKADMERIKAAREDASGDV